MRGGTGGGIPDWAVRLDADTSLIDAKITALKQTLASLATQAGQAATAAGGAAPKPASTQALAAQKLAAKGAEEAYEKVEAAAAKIGVALDLATTKAEQHLLVANQIAVAYRDAAANARQLAGVRINTGGGGGAPPPAGGAAPAGGGARGLWAGLTGLSNASKGVATELGGVHDSLTRVLTKTVQWSLAYGGVFAAVNLIKGSLSTIAEIDFEQAQIAKLFRADTMAAQTKAAQELTREAAALAGVYGESITNVQAEMKVFVRQGFDVAETAQLTARSLDLQKAANLDAADAAKFLTATMRQYNLEASDAAFVTDALNQLENTMAAEAKETATAVTLIGGAWTMAGGEIEEAMGMMAAVIEKTQRSGSEIGRAVRTVATRITTPESLNLLQGYNINLAATDGHMADIFTTLETLAAKWEFYTDVQRNEIALQLAGSRQRNVFVAMMESFPRTLDAVGESYNSLNSASLEVARTQDTLIGKVNILKASFQELLVTGQGGLTDNLKTALDNLTASIQNLEKTDPQKIQSKFAWAGGAAGSALGGMAARTVGGLAGGALASGATALGEAGILSAGAAGATAAWGAAMGPMSALLGAVILGVVGYNKVMGLFAESTRDGEAELARLAERMSDIGAEQKVLVDLVGAHENLGRQAHFAALQLDALASSSANAEEKQRRQREIVQGLEDDFQRIIGLEAKAGVEQDKRLTKRLEGLRNEKGGILGVRDVLLALSDAEVALAEVRRKAALEKMKQGVDEARASQRTLEMQVRAARAAAVYRRQEALSDPNAVAYMVGETVHYRSRTVAEVEALDSIKAADKAVTAYEKAMWEGGQALKKLSDEYRDMVGLLEIFKDKRSIVAEGEAASEPGKPVVPSLREIKLADIKGEGMTFMADLPKLFAEDIQAYLRAIGQQYSKEMGKWRARIELQGPGVIKDVDGVAKLVLGEVDPAIREVLRLRAAAQAEQAKSKAASVVRNAPKSVRPMTPAEALQMEVNAAGPLATEEGRYLATDAVTRAQLAAATAVNAANAAEQALTKEQRNVLLQWFKQQEEWSKAWTEAGTMSATLLFNVEGLGDALRKTSADLFNGPAGVQLLPDVLKQATKNVEEFFQQEMKLYEKISDLGFEMSSTSLSLDAVRKRETERDELMRQSEVLGRTLSDAGIYDFFAPFHDLVAGAFAVLDDDLAALKEVAGAVERGADEATAMKLGVAVIGGRRVSDLGTKQTYLRGFLKQFNADGVTAADAPRLAAAVETALQSGAIDSLPAQVIDGIFSAVRQYRLSEQVYKYYQQRQPSAQAEGFRGMVDALVTVEQALVGGLETYAEQLLEQAATMVTAGDRAKTAGGGTHFMAGIGARQRAIKLLSGGGPFGAGIQKRIDEQILGLQDEIGKLQEELIAAGIDKFKEGLADRRQEFDSQMTIAGQQPFGDRLTMQAELLNREIAEYLSVQGLLEAKIADSAGATADQLKGLVDMLKEAKREVDQLEAERAKILAEGLMGLDILAGTLNLPEGRGGPGSFRSFTDAIESVRSDRKRAGLGELATSLASARGEADKLQQRQVEEAMQSRNAALAAGGDFDAVTGKYDAAIRKGADLASEYVAAKFGDALDRALRDLQMETFREQQDTLSAEFANALVGGEAFENDIAQAIFDANRRAAELGRERDLRVQGLEDADARAKVIAEYGKREEEIYKQQSLAIQRIYRDRFLEMRAIHREFFEEVFHDLGQIGNAFKNLANTILSRSITQFINTWEPLAGFTESMGRQVAEGEVGKGPGAGQLTLIMGGMAAVGGAAAASASQPVPVQVFDRGQPVAWDALAPGLGNAPGGAAGLGADGKPLRDPRSGQLFGSNSLQQALGFAAIGMNGAQSKDPFMSLLNGGLQGFALSGGNPFGALLGGGIGLVTGFLGSLFGKKRGDPIKDNSPYQLPQLTDMRFAAPFMQPRSAFLGGRAGGLGDSRVDNSVTLDISNITIEVTGDLTEAEARRQGRAFISGMSQGAADLAQDYARVPTRRFG